MGTSVALIDLDKEWNSLYQQRLAGQSVTDQLVKVSTTAEQRGDATSATDPATAAGFYRIAATTAWTAGPPRNQQLLTLRDKGEGVCAKVNPDPAQQPRDCSFIRIAPELAILDQQAAATKALVSAGATLDGANLTKAKSVADTTVARGPRHPDSPRSSRCRTARGAPRRRGRSRAPGRTATT